MRFVMPYTHLSEEVTARLDASGHPFERCDVSGSIFDYSALMEGLWQPSTPGIVLVEHDVVIEPGSVDELLACPEDWCAFQVAYLGQAEGHPGLGCVKFSQELIARHPDAMELAGQIWDGEHQPRHWCLTPDARVLTADVRWRPLGEVRVGDQLIAGEEERSHAPARPYRRYLPSTVEAVAITRAKVLRIVLEDGTELRATEDHRFLGSRPQTRGEMRWLRVRWRAARDLVPGRDLLYRYLTPTAPLETRDAGYLAGLFDGEGSMTRSGQDLSFSQLPGPTLDAAVATMTRLNFRVHVAPSGAGPRLGRRVQVARINGGIAERLRLLAAVRPERLIAKLDIQALGWLEAHERLRVVAVEPAGEQDVVQMQTSSGTYLAEGFLSHNCRIDAWLQQLVLPGVEASTLGASGFTPDPAVPRETQHVHGPPLRHLRDDGRPPMPSHGCGPKVGCLIATDGELMPSRFVGALINVQVPPGGWHKAVAMDPSGTGAGVAHAIRGFLNIPGWRRLILWHPSVAGHPDAVVRHARHEVAVVTGVELGSERADFGMVSFERSILERWPPEALRLLGIHRGHPDPETVITTTRLLGGDVQKDTEIPLVHVAAEARQDGILLPGRDFHR